MNRTLSFADFWAKKDHEGILLLDRLFTYRVAVFFAYLAYKLGVTPNQVTFAACGLGCLSGLLAFFPQHEQRGLVHIHTGHLENFPRSALIR